VADQAYYEIVEDIRERIKAVKARCLSSDIYEFFKQSYNTASEKTNIEWYICFLPVTLPSFLLLYFTN
jgi:hypothetical protein